MSTKNRESRKLSHKRGRSSPVSKRLATLLAVSTTALACLAVLETAGCVAGNGLARGELTASNAHVTAQVSQTDVQTKYAIEHAFALDLEVPRHRIDIEVVDGIVLLEGVVENALERERPVELAKLFTGVRAVVDLISIEPDDRPDELVALECEHALASVLPRNELAPEVTNGVAILSGPVDSPRQRLIARQTIKSVKSVRKVIDTMRVRPNDAREDARIENEIFHCFRLDPLVDHVLVQARVTDGTVEIFGTAGGEADAKRAIELARVPGIAEVNAKGLKIADWARRRGIRYSRSIPRSDRSVEAAVRDAVSLDPRIEAERIEVLVEDGTITLVGCAASASERSAAIADAGNTPGVERVVSRLRVDNN